MSVKVIKDKKKLDPFKKDTGTVPIIVKIRIIPS